MQKELPDINNKHYAFTHILMIFFLLALFIVSNIYIMIPLLEDAAKEFAISASSASLSISIFSFFYACGLLFFGTFSERFGLKETICYGLFVLVILMIAIYFTQSFLSFLILRALQGFFAASFAPVSFIYVLNVLATKHQAVTIGIINSGFLAAGVIGQLISSSINVLFDWKYVFIILASVYFLIFIYAKKKLLSAPKQGNPKSFKKLLKVLVSLPLRNNLKMLYLVTFTTLLSFVAYYTFLDGYLNQVLGLSALTILSIRFLGLIGLVLTIFSEKIAVKFSYHFSIKIGLILKLIGLTFSYNTNTILITIGSIFFVAGISIVIPSLIQLIGKRGKENRGLAISMYSFILLLGASAGGMISFFSSPSIKFVVLALILIFATVMIHLEKALENR